MTWLLYGVMCLCVYTALMSHGGQYRNPYLPESFYRFRVFAIILTSVFWPFVAAALFIQKLCEKYNVKI